MKYILVLLLHCFMATASLVSTATAAEPELILRVQPGLCLRHSSHDSCALTVTVLWRDSSLSNYCLYSIQDRNAIHCWKNLDHATLVEDRVMSEDLVYWLSLPGQRARLVTAKIEIATLVDDSKRRRIKRRHVWNLI
jgi:Protein of unknown function (DUF3019)